MTERKDSRWIPRQSTGRDEITRDFISRSALLDAFQKFRAITITSTPGAHASLQGPQDWSGFDFGNWQLGLSAVQSNATTGDVIILTGAPISAHPIVLDDLLPLVRKQVAPRRGIIEEKLDSLLETALEEVFEDGMDSRFSRDLLRFFDLYNLEGMRLLSSRAAAESISPRALGEVLRILGRSEVRATQRERFWLLARCLFHSSPVVRDAAGLGLASLGDKNAIPYIHKAIEREPILELKRDLDLVIADLEA